MGHYSPVGWLGTLLLNYICDHVRISDPAKNLGSEKSSSPIGHPFRCGLKIFFLQGLTLAGSCREVSVHPKLCVVPLVMGCHFCGHDQTIKSAYTAVSFCQSVSFDSKAPMSAIAAKQPLSLRPNHLPQRLAINGPPNPKAQNFGCALVRSGTAMRRNQALQHQLELMRRVRSQF